jgi:hypothetical protein
MTTTTATIQNDNITVANTIREQLGRRAFAMMGAKNLFAKGPGLQFDVGTNAKKISRIIITLDPSDTYTVKAYKGRGINTKLVSTTSDVYADSLHTVIESLTGLYLSL